MSEPFNYSSIYILLPICQTIKPAFLVEIQKAFISLFYQVKHKEALLASNLLGITCAE